MSYFKNMIGYGYGLKFVLLLSQPGNDDAFVVLRELVKTIVKIN
jgi:hypothetical protein